MIRMRGQASEMGPNSDLSYKGLPRLGHNHSIHSVSI